MEHRQESAAAAAAAEPEVYETSDVEEDAGVVREDDTSPEIEKIGFKIDDAFNLFNKNSLQGTINFDPVADRSLADAGYKIYRSEESVDQRLARIARELEEIKAQTTEDPDKTQQLVELAEQLQRQEQPHDDVFGARVAKLFDGVEKRLELDAVPASGPNYDHLIELEKQVARLELKLGDSLLNSPHNSVDHMINDLQRKLKVVENPEYQLEQTQHTLDELVQRQERLHTNEPLTGSSIDAFKTAKIDELVRYLPQLEQFERQAPLLLQRLETMHGVHSEIAHSVDFVGQVESVLVNLSEETLKWESSLREINAKLDAGEVTFQANRAELDGVVAGLHARLDKLQ